MLPSCVSRGWGQGRGLGASVAIYRLEQICFVLSKLPVDLAPDVIRRGTWAGGSGSNRPGHDRGLVHSSAGILLCVRYILHVSISLVLKCFQVMVNGGNGHLLSYNYVIGC